MPSKLPDWPWQKIATDLFQYENKMYLVIIDFYSRWVECPLLLSTTSNGVISHLKSVFSKYGIPEQVFSDCGVQYTSFEFAEFAREYGFEHMTSSPYFPQSNGMSEKGVNIVKNLFKRCTISGEDPYIALMNYRSTPLKNGYSPAELLMGRKIRTKVPILPSNLNPSQVDTEKIVSHENEYRRKYKEYYDTHTGARDLPKVMVNDRVLLKRGGEGVVLSEHSSPRSYIVEKDDGGVVRRNRKHFVKLFSQVAPPPAESSTPPPVEHPPPVEPPPPLAPKPTKRKPKAAPDGPVRVSMRFNKGIPRERMNL